MAIQFAAAAHSMRILRHYRDERPQAATQTPGPNDRRARRTPRHWLAARVFFVDDNCVGDKKLVKRLLRTLVAWQQARRQPQVDFITEASVNLADDQESGPDGRGRVSSACFLASRLPCGEPAKSVGNYQNTHGELQKESRTTRQSGYEVMGGFIIGFDNDPQEIFQLQFDFIQKTGIATAMVGLLTALPKRNSISGS